MKRTVSLFALCCAFLAVFAIRSMAVTCSEQQITFNAGTQEVPRISGDGIIWTDWRNGTQEIYMFDLLTGVETRLPVSAGSYTAQTDIDSGVVVWSRNTWEDISLFDIDGGNERLIADAASHQVRPVIDGTNIVWEDYRSGGSEVYLYDLVSDTEHLVSQVNHGTSINNGGAPWVHRNIIVWQGMSAANWWDIYLYDMGPDARFGTADDLGERLVASAPETQAKPVVYNNIIAWMDIRNGNWDIYLYDLSTGEERQVTASPAFQGNPAIFGSRIAYEDNRNGNVDIFVYEVLTGTETQVTTDATNQSWVDMYENKVVYGDFRNGNGDIFMSVCDFAPLDADGDGFELPEDCNDADASIHPGAPEIKHDGIDQDCNGFDLTIDVIKANYSAADDGLKVEATSILAGAANLEVVNFGVMTWKPNKMRWGLGVQPAGGNPGTVTVCGVEGCEMSPVTEQ